MITERPSRSRRTALVIAVAAVLAAGVAAVPQPATAKSSGCAALTKQVGITKKSILIGNAVDLSGPVPNVFRSAQLATRAYVASFNSSKRICGRKLKLHTYDTATSVGANTAAYRTMCSRDFAAVGSISAFDDGGAALTAACRLPDVRVASLSSTRNTCATCFGVNAHGTGEVPNSVSDYFVANRPAVVAKAAMLYLNVPPSQAIAQSRVEAAQKRGFTYVYTRAIDVADFNYGPYVQQMKQQGVRSVEFVGARQQTVRLAQAMATAGFHPDVFRVETDAYVPSYAAADPSVAGSIVAINFTPLNAGPKELSRYRYWLNKVAPGEEPTAEGLYAWSAAKLFAKRARALGPKLSRATLVKKLRATTAWTADGLHVPQQVGTKHVSPCTRLLYLKDGSWVSIGGTGYRCTGVTKTT